MTKRMLRKDIRQAFAHSRGRFVSIVCLMALGSFALVGLWVTGPDMQITGADYYDEHNLADVTVLSDYGLSEDDRKVIGQTAGVKDVEFGYFKDTVIENTDRTVRVYSSPRQVSTYELREGRMPRNAKEIALGESLMDKYAIGSTIRFSEKPDIAGDTVLNGHEYRVVGFVLASDAISGLNMGQSTAGSGVLDDYALIAESAFDSDVAMVAKLTFRDTQDLDYWSDEYRDAVQAHKDTLTKRLAGQPAKREGDIREQRREQIAKARQQVDEAKRQLADAENQLADAKARLDQGRDQLTQGQIEAINDAQASANAIHGSISRLGDSTDALRDTQRRLEESIDALGASRPTSVDDLNSRIDAVVSSLDALHGQLSGTADQLDRTRLDLQSEAAGLAANGGDDAERMVEARDELDKGEEEYQRRLDEFNAAKPEAEENIADAEKDIALAEEKVDGLTVPAYSIDGRREGLTSEGYRVYMTIAQIVAKLAAIFPIFLYLVAALVTFTTMGRMVDEERTNSGTLKALGYSNADVMRKFTIYGFAASTVGTLIGVALGHTLLPYIVYHAYSDGFTMPLIAMDFHPGVTAVAFALAWASAVLPTWLAASRELREKPAALLLPKPPAKGSKILLERITPLWRIFDFTHKVTARNIFRYKTRLFMTVFGVAGATALLVTGLGVQGSIDQIGDRQFGDLIHYDLIVAEQSDNNDEQRGEVEAALRDKSVESSMPIAYEEMSWTGGKNGDKQTMTLLAVDDTYNLADYMTLRDRSTHEPQVLTDDGAVISERMAEMMGLDVGDSFTVMDAGGDERTIRVGGVSEMYIGHFIYMSSGGYARVFGRDWAANAHMVRLRDGSSENAAAQGARIMECSGVKSVVQNITQRKMVDTIVTSLNQIMEVLIVVAALLTVVILYNLTNLNVSERIRELSTIKVLGFHSSETTMYIYRETIAESLIGILCGYVFGAWLHRYIITEVPPDEVMFDPAITWGAFVAPVIVVGVVLAALGWVVYRRLRTVDMLAALKSVE